MKNHTDPAELYDEAVGDGASAPDSENVAAQTQLVESNASNYGASAIGPIESEKSEKRNP